MRPGQASLVQGVILASSALFMPVVLWMGRRWEKKIAYIVSVTSWLFVMLGILLVPQGSIPLAFLIAALVGPGIAAAHALPRAMSADTLDVDQMLSGRRQEGVYAGIEVFARKISVKVVLAAVGPILAWSGYVEDAATQTPAALFAIRFLLAVVPSVILIAAILFAWNYPLSRERHQEVQTELGKRGLLEKRGSETN